MQFLRRLLPTPIRRFFRKSIDRLSYRASDDLVTLGGESPYTVRSSLLPPQPLVYSAGVGKDISFEIALAEQFKAIVHLFDPTPTAHETIRFLNNIPPTIRFHPVGLAGTAGTLSFLSPENPEEGSFRLPSVPDRSKEIRFPCTSVSAFMKSNGDVKIDLLKLDVEGFEYEIIEDLMRNGIVPTQLCVEFHHFLAGIPKSTTRRAMRRLQKSGYSIGFKRGLDYLFWRKPGPAHAD